MTSTMVFTLQTKEAPGYFDLLASARRWGWPLRTFWVKEDESLSFEENYHATIARKHHLIRDILTKELPEKFLFLDAWDTVFIGPYEELSIPDDPFYLSFSAAGDCYPEPGYARLFTQGHHPYPNTGVIWGAASKYRWSCPKEEVLDQLAWTRLIAQAPTAFNLDTESKVALTYFRESQGVFQRKDGRWHYLPTGSRPLIVHAAGKWPMPEFLK